MLHKLERPSAFRFSLGPPSSLHHSLEPPIPPSLGWRGRRLHDFDVFKLSAWRRHALRLSLEPPSSQSGAPSLGWRSRRLQTLTVFEISAWRCHALHLSLESPSSLRLSLEPSPSLSPSPDLRCRTFTGMEGRRAEDLTQPRAAELPQSRPGDAMPLCFIPEPPSSSIKASIEPQTVALRWLRTLTSFDPS